MVKGKKYTDGVISGILVNTYPSPNGEDIAILQLEDGTKIKVLVATLIEVSEEGKDDLEQEAMISRQDIMNELNKIKNGYIEKSGIEGFKRFLLTDVFSNIYANLCNQLEYDDKEKDEKIPVTKMQLVEACANASYEMIDNYGFRIVSVMLIIMETLCQVFFGTEEK